MKKLSFLIVLPILCFASLSGCGDREQAEKDFLTQNLAVWNKAHKLVSDDQLEDVGKPGNTLTKDVIKISERLLSDEQARQSVPEDGAALQAATIAYLQVSVNLYKALDSALEKSTQPLPSNQPILAQIMVVRDLSMRQEQKEDAWDKAQQDFAKRHDIALTGEDKAP